jgi:dCTP deaminase
MILNDKQILSLCHKDNLLDTYIPDKSKSGISYGVEGFSYDIRLGNKLQVFNPDIIFRYNNVDDKSSHTIDPKNFNKDILIDLHLYNNEYFLLPPNSFSLGHSIEYIKMPKDCIAFLLNKSSYARCGIDIDNTKIEPNFEGQIVIEIHNKTPYFVKLYANEGIGSLVFLKGELPSTFYEGKYQNQLGITTVK